MSLFVEDAVRAYLDIARCKECHGRVYNLPGAHYASTPDVLRELVAFVGDLQDTAISQNSKSLLARHKWNRSIRIVPSDPKLLTISKQHLDGTRIRQEAGFEPETSFRDGLKTTALFYAWFFNHIVPKTAAPSFETPLPELEHGFETITSDDGLPVQLLRPRVLPGPKACPGRPPAFVVTAPLL